MKRGSPEFSSGLRKRRDRLHIIAQILDVASEGSLKTQIMYGANLSFSQLNEYLSFLLGVKFLDNHTEKRHLTYTTTPKGFKFLRSYQTLRELLRKEVS